MSDIDKSAVFAATTTIRTQLDAIEAAAKNSAQAAVPSLLNAVQRSRATVEQIESFFLGGHAAF